MPVARTFKHVADRQDCAAEIPEHDHAVALVGPPDRVAYEPVVGSERSPGTSARGLDPDLGTRDLARQLGDSASEVGAVRDNYDPNHSIASIAVQVNEVSLQY
jgi:hypothetical protein